MIQYDRVLIQKDKGNKPELTSKIVYASLLRQMTAKSGFESLLCRWTYTYKGQLLLC